MAQTMEEEVRARVCARVHWRIAGSDHARDQNRGVQMAKWKRTNECQAYVPQEMECHCGEPDLARQTYI